MDWIFKIRIFVSSQKFVKGCYKALLVTEIRGKFEIKSQLNAVIKRK